MGASASKATNENLQSPAMTEEDAMLSRIGSVTRNLHDNLVGLGLDKILDEVAQNIPDARDRLDYVTKKTHEAAEKVLNATDVAIPLQESFQEDIKQIEQKLTEIQSKPTLKSGYDQGVKDTLAFLATASEKSDQTKALLLEIMMAQDFQDLTGQVVQRITNLAQTIENQLVQVLLDFSPEEKKANLTQKSAASDEQALMNGPQVNQEAENIVTNQEQVDDLLDSLGF